jgi:hypothetical protein
MSEHQASGPARLALPLDLTSDPKATELATVWTGDERQFYILDVKQFRETPGIWGMMAIDLMKHAARAYEQLDGRPRQEVYKEILAGFAAEMQNPTEPL